MTNLRSPVTNQNQLTNIFNYQIKIRNSFHQLQTTGKYHTDFSQMATPPLLLVRAKIPWHWTWNVSLFTCVMMMSGDLALDVHNLLENMLLFGH